MNAAVRTNVRFPPKADIIALLDRLGRNGCDGGGAVALCSHHSGRMDKRRLIKPAAMLAGASLPDQLCGNSADSLRTGAGHCKC